MTFFFGGGGDYANLEGKRERFIEEKNKKRQRKKMIANNDVDII